MSTNPIGALLALWMLALPVSPALAQVFFGGNRANVPEINRPGAVSDDGDGMCNGTPGGSRIRPNCEEAKTARMRAQAEQVPAVPPLVPQCQASTQIGYTPRDAAVHLDGSIVVKSCPAGSTGAYTIVLSVKKESGETTLEFTEGWQRTDRPNVRFTSDYPIGEGAELVDVRLRDLTCTCNEAAAPAEPQPTSDPRQEPAPRPAAP
jgi:hypothetical protein